MKACRHILSIDRGSSSLKIALYEVDATCEQLLLQGEIEKPDIPNAELRLRDYRASPPDEMRRSLGNATPIAALLAFLGGSGISVDGVGHRLVYGGAAHEAPARVTARLMASLTTLVPFDPLHLPEALAGIREVEAALPEVAQVVCFDTAFHSSMPMVAQRLPLPRELWSEGIRRYGFHGLSYESIVRRLGKEGTRGRMIVAHLGSGASIAAMRDGKPIDTTMGFSPLGGLMMSTRPGDLDPGVLLYLLREGQCTLEELNDTMTCHSGLLGVSQISPDMKTLLERREADVRAAEAVELFVYQARKYIGALAAVIGGLDTLVFTGGIGENSPPVRAEIVSGLGYLGVDLDLVRNAAGAGIISADGGRVVVCVIAAKENLMVARHTFTVLFASASAKPAAAFDGCG